MCTPLLFPQHPQARVSLHAGDLQPQQSQNLLEIKTVHRSPPQEGENHTGFTSQWRHWSSNTNLLHRCYSSINILLNCSVLALNYPSAFFSTTSRPPDACVHVTGIQLGRAAGARMPYDHWPREVAPGCHLPFVSARAQAPNPVSRTVRLYLRTLPCTQAQRHGAFQCLHSKSKAVRLKQGAGTCFSNFPCLYPTHRLES